MRKSLAWKTLFRAPLKTLVTFLLVAAASFALFSRVTDFAITLRETAQAERFYSGVAALDNSMPDMTLEEESGMTGWTMTYTVEGKPWPTEDEIKEFSSMPGVTLADQRYLTAGRIENFERMIDKEETDFEEGMFVMEGTFTGYSDSQDSSGIVNTGSIDLSFEDVKLLAADRGGIEPEDLKTVSAPTGDGLTLIDLAYPRAFFEGLEQGCRCILIGNVRYYGVTLATDEGSFAVVDGQGENYLAKKAFAYQKGMVEALNQNRYTYDIVYTSDTRAIPRFNERSMVITRGRPLTKEDADGCVVHEQFLETNGLSVGDTIHVQLGDRLFWQSVSWGAQAYNGDFLSNFPNDTELTIVGAYKDIDDYRSRIMDSDWGYTVNTVFVPSSLLAAEVDADREPGIGEFSVLIENARDINAFRNAAEPFVASLGIHMRFSDGGWLSIQESFETGLRTACFTTVLYLIGAVLALFLAVYLYVGRNKKSYAIMRTLGVPPRKATNTVVLPLVCLSALAIPVGAAAGIFYTAKTAAKTLAAMAESAPHDYVPDTSLPVGAVVLCLVCELMLTAFLTLVFLWGMKRTPPLELLQENTAKTRQARISRTSADEPSAPPAAFEIAKLSAAFELPAPARCSSLRQLCAYTARHMRRGVTKTVLSLLLASVMTAGVGLFVLAKLTYHDTCLGMDVPGRAINYSSISVASLLDSPLLGDAYCYGSFSVRINGQNAPMQMTVTNNLDRYLNSEYSVTYAKGYDAAAMEGTGSLCLIGETLAKDLDVKPGDNVTLISQAMYSVLEQQTESDDALLALAEEKSSPFKVAGTISSKDDVISTGIYAAANEAPQSVYGQPYPFEYLEFTLADNEKLEETEDMLAKKAESDKQYTAASFYIDSAGLKNMMRIRDLLDSLFPIAVAAALLIGLICPGLVILQSAWEAAVLRVLGVTKLRARCMLVLEQTALCIAGTALSTGILALCSRNLFARSAKTLVVCFTLYLLAEVLGTLAASVQVTRHKALELLQIKE